jgi:hypothetical protein
MDAIKGIEPRGIAAYRSALVEALGILALDGIATARRAVPAAKRVQLADPIDRLPTKLAEKVKARAALLVGKQIGDLKSVVAFAYAMNEDTTDSDDQILSDMRDSAVGWLDGTGLKAGADLTASTVINDARDAFFYDEEVLEEIEGFEFVNGDPVSPICQDLAGTVFGKDDPNAFRYTPPLHWNCKSYIQPILRGQLGDALKRAKQDDVVALKPSSKRLDAHVQFAESLARAHAGDAGDGCPTCAIRHRA